MNTQRNTPSRSTPSNTQRSGGSEAGGQQEGLRHPIDDQQRVKQRLDDADLDGDLDAFVRDHAESAYHPCGTCRIGRADDAHAVVDPTTSVPTASMLTIPRTCIRTISLRNVRRRAPLCQSAGIHSRNRAEIF